MTTTVPDEVTVRQAERADLLAVNRIERGSFPQPWPYGAFEGFLGQEGFLVAVKERGTGPGEVCGYVIADVVTEFGRTGGHVKDLAVAPEWRGRGVGSQLLDRGLAVLAAGGARVAKLEVRIGNEAARGLYESFGFSPNRIVPEYYDDGEDALVLIADLRDR